MGGSRRFGAPGPGARWVQTACRALATTLSRFRVEGLEHVPSGPCLLVFNHLSNFDPPLIYAALPRSDVVALVAAEYRSNRIFRPFVEAQGSMWLRRGEGDRETLQAALAALRAGRVVAMSPEGGRSRTGQLRRALPGAGFLCRRAGVPVLPVGVVGTPRLHRSWYRGIRPEVTVRFGMPIRDPVPAAGDRRSRDRAAVDGMMREVARLIPPSYRGAYAGSFADVDGRAARVEGRGVRAPAAVPSRRDRAPGRRSGETR